MIMGGLASDEPLLVRVHSECFTGDVMGSLRCDCGEQLEQALLAIAERGRGLLIYLRQEGRGIGLPDKLRAYNLQDEGYDTVDANLLLGHEPDERDYLVAAGILNDLGVDRIMLLTNNPHKIKQLETYGVQVVARLPLQIKARPENASYLRTKFTRMNHLLSVDGNRQSSDGEQPHEPPA